MNCHSVFNCVGHNHELTNNRLIKETVLKYVNEAEFKELFTIAALEKVETVTSSAIAATTSAIKASLDARNAVDDLTIQTIDFVIDAINNTAVEGGVLADTFVTVTPNGVGTVARTQRDVNSEYMSINDFGGDFVAAGNWIKQNVNNFCYLEAGKEYTLNGTGDVYFNRYICRNGKATITVPATSRLRYLEKVDGTEVIRLEGIRFNILGHRLSSASTEYGDNQVYPASQHITSVRSAYIKEVDVYGLLDIADKDSWVDDTGESRVDSFISYKVSESSFIDDVNTYGVAAVFTILASSDKANHVERNIVAHNCETLIYLPEADGANIANWSVGESTKIYIVNTKENKKYWLRSAGGINYNGKDCIMCMADHNIVYKVDDVRATNAIERTLYIMSKNCEATNIYDEGSASGAGLKSGFTPKDAEYKSTLSNVVCRNTALVSGVVQAYGWDTLEIDNVKVYLPLTKAHWVFPVANIRDLRIKNVYVENGGVVIYPTNDAVMDSITAENMVLNNVGDFNYPAIFCKRPSDAVIVNNLVLRNIQVQETRNSYDNFYGSAIALWDVKRAVLDNIEGYSVKYPFEINDKTEYVEVVNSRFTVVNTLPYKDMWEWLKSTGKCLANVFDFSVTFRTSNTVANTFKAQFRKGNDTGLVRCADYWTNINITHMSVSEGTGIRLLILDGESFEVKASFKNNSVYAFYDSVTGSLSNIRKVGTLVDTANHPGGVRIYIYEEAGSKFFVVDVAGEGTWQHGLHPIEISITRL